MLREGDLRGVATFSMEGAYFGLLRATSCARDDDNFFAPKTFVILSISEATQNLKNINRDISLMLNMTKTAVIARI